MRARWPGPTSLPAAVLVLALASVARPTLALEPGKRFEQYAHVPWPGVTRTATVHAVAFARGGHLWVGGAEGVARFDGHVQSPFEGGRLPGLGQGAVRALLEAADGTLWIGTATSGLARLAGSAVTVFPFGGGAPEAQVLALVQTGDGTVWAAGQQGVLRFAPGRDHPLAAGDGLPANCTHALAVVADLPWAGTHAGLARWTGRAWEPVPLPAPGITTVDALVAEPGGVLWVGTRHTGLWRRAPDGAWRNFGVEAGLGTSDIATAHRDRAGRLWVATHGTRSADRTGTLTWLDGDRFRTFPLPSRLCADRIEALADDAEGGLWIATESCGLHRLSDRPFHGLTTEDGLPSDRVLGLAPSGDAALVGTRGAGTARLQLGSRAVERLACAPGLPCDECWDFSAGARGFLAVCRENTVLRADDGQAVRRFGPLPGGLPEASFALAASDGALWFALDRKVVRAHGGAVEALAKQEPFQGPRILFEGPPGTIWIAADDGLARWRAGQLDLVRLPPGHRPAEVASFHPDADGTLWMATKGEGIRRLRGGRLATVGVAHGLPTGWIVQLLADDRGRLWASSARGIFSIDRRELDEVAEGRRPRLNPALYDAGDGITMRGDAFGHPAGFKDPRGRLWFATHGGIVVVDPSSRAPAPRAIIEELRLGGRRRAPGSAQAPVATGGAADLEATFAASTFAAPDTVSYRYKLRAGDRDWIELGAGRTLQQPRLEPGRYQLAVAARTRGGDWSDLPTRLDFTVRPAFYRSPAFLAAAAVALALLLLALHRARLARARAGLEAVVAERTRIAREIHDTLAQAFVATSVQLECLEDALEGDPRGPTSKIRRHLDTAKKVVAESLDEARRAVWVLRPQAVEPGLVPALETLVSRLSGGTAVALEVSGAPRELPPLVASNLLRIAHEAVANAHRHAHARRIDLRLAFAPRSVTLSVADDGQGMPAGDAPGPAQGILGMQERAAQIGGALSIEAQPERGTTIRVEVAA